MTIALRNWVSRTRRECCMRKAAPTLDFRRRQAAQAFSIRVRLDLPAERGTEREPLRLMSPFRELLADVWCCAGRSAGGFPAADMGKRQPR